MTQDEIIALAIEAGFGEPVNHKDWHLPFSAVEAFAKLVAAKKEKDIIKTIQSLGTWATCEQIEKAIKVRGIK